MVSFDEGHRTILAALSEYRIAYNELFRFQSLVSALRIPDFVPDVTFPMKEDGIWEARTAFMALINALTNCPHALEERIVLRDEFSRRGLNEVVAVRPGSFSMSMVEWGILTSHPFLGAPIHQTSRFAAQTIGYVHGGEIRGRRRLP